LKSILKIQLTFNEIEYPSSLTPLLEMSPHIRARFCKQVLELFFREGGTRDGIWPARTSTVATRVAESRDQHFVPNKAELEGSIEAETFDGSFADYFK
jgi:hypothetical protein